MNENSQVLNPCPSCGKRFDFPLTGCMTFVKDSLVADSGGKCPECGVQVIVENSTDGVEPLNALAAAKTDDQKCKVKIVDLPLSVRCRLQVHKLGVETLGEFLDLPFDKIREHFCESPDYVDQIQTMLSEYGIKWDSRLE